MRPCVVEQQLLHQRVAQAHDRRALVLAADLPRVERLADVGHGHVPGQQRLAGLAVDLDLDRGAVELVERRGAAERVLGLGLLAHLADADDLATERAEAARRARPGWAARGRRCRTSPRSTAMSASSTPSSRAAIARTSPDVPAAVQHGRPMNTDDRLADVCWSYGTTAGVAHDDVTRSSGAPSSWATICAKMCVRPGPCPTCPRRRSRCRRRAAGPSRTTGRSSAPT